VTFEDLKLIPEILQALKAAGYSNPTPIQVDAIPPALEGRDIVGCAQTGTGKTAAFAIPILQHIDRHAGDDPIIRALIVTPTRELAAQIGTSFTSYGRNLDDIWHTVIYGGVSEKPQIKDIRQGVDTLIATPGRLLDLMGQGIISLDRIEIFVLDEADRMLDMGFLPDVKRIVAKLPPKRQTLFFSATMPPVIRELAETMLKDPVSVAVAPIAAPAERVKQHIFFVDKKEKRRLLLHLLGGDSIERALVFSRTKHGANRIAQVLTREGIEALAIHGNKSQGARTRALDKFRDGSLRVLVATDLAARGIDVASVSHVINFDLPNEPETYVHRIGRTARAGAQGIAFSFCDVDERPYLRDIERLIQMHIERVDDHPHASTQAPPPETQLTGENHPRGPAKGGRPRGGNRPPQRRNPRRGPSGGGRGGSGGGRGGSGGGRGGSGGGRGGSGGGRGGSGGGRGGSGGGRGGSGGGRGGSGGGGSRGGSGGSGSSSASSS